VAGAGFPRLMFEAVGAHAAARLNGPRIGLPYTHYLGCLATATSAKACVACSGTSPI
jgi:hypothetical protein